jgi:DNA-binding NtrC family response regulator
MSEQRTLTTRMVEGIRGRLELERATIRVTRGPDRGLALELGIDSVLIGSSPRCQLVLHDETVSSVHAEVQVSTAGYLIRDRGSRNGIRLRGFPVTEAPLVDGMTLLLGESELKIRSRGGATQAFDLAAPGIMAGLVAHSVKMRAVVAIVERLAPTELPVLIEGESGTGKDLLATAVHQLSNRSDGPLVIADCAAIPGSLIAAELFGYERGAFTGADARHPGLFEQAEGGTIFLDEIGDLPLEQQVALLGVLERRSVRRVGGSTPVALDARVVAATNHNLEEDVRAGRFRRDLFHRLAVGRLRVPPLRERPEDIAPLLRRFAAEQGVSVNEELLRIALGYHWPGNVRELRNFVAAQAVGHPSLGMNVVHGGKFGTEDGLGMLPLAAARELARDEFEREYLGEAIARAGGNLTRAAELAGITRVRMMQLAAKHRLRVCDIREQIEKH